MIITVEGIDGSGKTRMSENVADWLHAKHLSFPGYEVHSTGPLIKSYLARGWHVDVSGEHLTDEINSATASALCHQALNVMNRVQLIGQIQSHPVVVLARGWESGYVYGVMDGLDPTVAMTSRVVFDLLRRAQLHILLDCDVDVAMKRRADRDGTLKPERYEAKRESLEAARLGYLTLWEAERVMSVTRENRWDIVNASRSVEQVWEEVQLRVVTFIRKLAETTVKL